ncbi:MAG: NAD(P)/FAD-dependent oxidoreductase [Phycisphaerales bacterium]
MTVSWWRRSRSPARVEVPVAVVGAGVAGLSAALHLQEMGLDGVLLERHGVGSGASTRNAGFLMRGAADNYALACRQYGRDVASTLWRWTEENLTLLRAGGLTGLASYAPRASCLMALDEGELGELRESLALLREDGFDAGWIERGAGDDVVMGPGGAGLGGLINPHDGVVNPHELLGLLRSQLRWPVLEMTEVAEVAGVAAGVELRTAEVVVRCSRAMLCLNAYAALLLPEMEGVVEPNRGQMLALHASERELALRHAYYANRGNEYFRRADADTVVVGGCRAMHAAHEKTWDDRWTSLVQGSLESFAESMFGARLPVKARWAGTMGFTRDHLPLIGAVEGFEKSVWFCGGFTGHGMSLAHRATLCAARLMMGVSGEGNPFAIARAR